MILEKIKNREKRYSPNHVCLCVCVAAAVFIVFAGKSLWIPASKIPYPPLRTAVLAVTDLLAVPGEATGLSGILPAVKAAFIQKAGLSGNPSWDSVFYNKRRESASVSVAGESLTSGARPVSGISAAETSGGISGTGIVLPGNTPAEKDAAGTDPVTGEPESGIAAGSSKPAGAYAWRYVYTTGADGQQKRVRMDSGNTISFFSAQNPLKVLVFGDSQVTSLGAGLERLVGARSSIQVTSIGIVSSGFIRDDYYDWPAKLADLFSKEQFDVIVFMLGMNDNIPFVKNGRSVRRKTPEWQAMYEPRCREIIDLVVHAAPCVYWLEMPLPRSESYNENLKFIDGIHTQIAQTYPDSVLVRVPVRDIFPGKEKPYAEKMQLADGRQLRVMGEDGLHYTIPGAQIIMKHIFDLIAGGFYFPEPPVAHLP